MECRSEFDLKIRQNAQDYSRNFDKEKYIPLDFDPGGAAETEHARHLHQGVGVVVADPSRKYRLVVGHEEINPFMAPLVVAHPVTPHTHPKGLEPGDGVRFTIDANRRPIVDIGVPSR